MFRNALYYPHILLPDDDWLSKAILFWQTINPIVPYDVKIPENHATQVLQKARLLQFIHPEDFLEDAEGVRFTEDFVHFLEMPGFLSAVGKKTKFSDIYTMHGRKFGSRAMEFLRQKGLVQKGNGPWVMVPNEIGQLYIAWLAGEIARKGHLHPITDDNKYHEKMLLSQILPMGKAVVAPFISYESLILNDALPVPRRVGQLDKLIKFRDDHQRELLQFTQWVANAAEELRKISDKEKIEQRLSLLKVQLEEQKLSIQERLKENGFKVKAECLEILIDFKLENVPIPVVGAIVGSWGGLIGMVVGAGIGHLTVAGMKIYSRYCKGTIKSQSILREYPAAYVFNIEKNL